MSVYTTQNDLLLNKLLDFYKESDNLDKILQIINGQSKISLRIVDCLLLIMLKNILQYIHYLILKKDSRFIWIINLN